MNLGNFSVSLNVKDLKVSLDFYQKLGFEQIGGEASQGWVILQNETTKIGLFQGMFERNLLTFNPGWAVDGEHPDEFMDVREIQARLKERGIQLTSEADADSEGPGSCMLVDPDGNPILIDQHR